MNSEHNQVLKTNNKHADYNNYYMNKAEKQNIKNKVMQITKGAGTKQTLDDPYADSKQVINPIFP